MDRKNLTVKLDGGAMALYEEGEKRGTVPLTLLERMVVRGNINVESRLLCEMGKRKIDVIFLSARHSYESAMAFSHSHNDVRRRLSQYQSYWNETQRLMLATELVAAKCAKQSQYLKRALTLRPDKRRQLFKGVKVLQNIIGQLDSSMAIDRLRGLEGSAAAHYFSAYQALFAPKLGFNKRQRRPPPDPVNACLSLGYTLLHFEAATVCRQVGLEPFLGFYHEPAFGRESLACDLIEPLRPRLDEWVWRLFRDKQLDSAHFFSENQRCLLNKAGRKIFYAQYELFCHPLRRLLRLQGYRLAQFYLQSAEADFK